MEKKRKKKERKKKPSFNNKTRKSYERNTQIGFLHFSFSFFLIQSPSLNSQISKKKKIDHETYAKKGNNWTKNGLG